MDKLIIETQNLTKQYGAQKSVDSSFIVVVFPAPFRPRSP